MKMRRQGRGFTLVELLVIIGVVGLLAAMLFPVFAQAREKARQVTCASNLRQIGMAVMLYSHDYDEAYPGGFGTPPFLWIPGTEGDWEHIWIRTGADFASLSVAARIRHYVRSERLFLCPNDPNGDAYSSGLWQSRFARASYSWEEGLSIGRSQPDYPAGVLQVSGQPLSLTDVSRPSLLPMAWEVGPHALFRPVSAAPRNICFADGHARFTRIVNWQFVQSDRNPVFWNRSNPGQPLDVERPCSPTCAAEARQP